MTRDADFKNVVRARMARTGESYSGARARLRADTTAVLHVTNGDSAADVLRAGGTTDVVLPWRDVLHLGPVPATDQDSLRRIRAGYLAATGWTTEHDALASLAQRDATLLAHRGEYLLWFEADLYDQLQLTQVLAGLHAAGTDAGRISLVCVGEYPGIGHFGGLGELTPQQLRDLTPVRLTAAALDLATTAWAALCAPQPSGHRGLAAAVSGELRFLPEAFDRLGREFPSTRDGLSLTERRILASLDDGELPAGELFTRTWAREPRPFLGDAGCFRIVDELAAGARPLLSVRPAGPTTRQHLAALTDDGRRVLDGAADRAALAGIDRWIGGVHLTGTAPAWRWHEGTETLVPG